MMQLRMNMLQLIADEREVNPEFHPLWDIISKEYLEVFATTMEAKTFNLFLEPGEVSEHLRRNVATMKQLGMTLSQEVHFVAVPLLTTRCWLLIETDNNGPKTVFNDS